MNRAEKQQMVETLGEQFRSLSSAILIDYRGLKVVEATDLRRKVREIDGTYLVVKNTLALRASKETKLEQIIPYFQGPTALAYHDSDIVGLARVLTDFAKTNPSVAFKAALVEGKVFPPSEIQALAAMPSREILLSMLLSVLQAPLQKLASVLKAPVRDLALVLKQIKK